MEKSVPVYEVILGDDDFDTLFTTPPPPPTPALRSTPEPTRRRSWSSKSEPKKRSASAGVTFDLSRRSEEKTATPAFYQTIFPKRIVEYINRSKSACADLCYRRGKSGEDTTKRTPKQLLLQGGHSLIQKVKKLSGDKTAASKRGHDIDDKEIIPKKLPTIAAVIPKPIPRKKGPLGKSWIRSNPDIKYVDEDLTESSDAYGEENLNITVSDQEMQDDYRWTYGTKDETVEYEAKVTEHIYCEIEEIKQSKARAKAEEEPRELSIRGESLQDYEGDDTIDESIDEILIEMVVDNVDQDESGTEKFLDCVEDYLTDLPELPEEDEEENQFTLAVESVIPTPPPRHSPRKRRKKIPVPPLTKYKPPRPPPPVRKSKSHSAPPSVERSPTPIIVGEIPKKPPRCNKRKKPQPVFEEHIRLESPEHYSIPPYAKVKKIKKSTKSPNLFDFEEESPPPVPIKIEELLRPLVPPRTHRPKSLTFAEQVRHMADITNHPEIPQRGLKKTSILHQNGDIVSTDSRVKRGDLNVISRRNAFKNRTNTFEPHRIAPPPPTSANKLGSVCFNNNNRISYVEGSDDSCLSLRSQCAPKLQAHKLLEGDKPFSECQFDEDFYRTSRKPTTLFDPGGIDDSDIDTEDLKAQIEAGTEDITGRIERIKAVLENVIVPSRLPSNFNGNPIYAEHFRKPCHQPSPPRGAIPKSKSLPRDSRLNVRKDLGSLWCDDESGGTLGDIDSSEANRSWRGSLDSNILASSSSSSNDSSKFKRLINFFGSFGKGARRRSKSSPKMKLTKPRKTSHSQFYYEISCSDSKINPLCSTTDGGAADRASRYAVKVLGAEGSQHFANVLAELSRTILLKSALAAEKPEMQPHLSISSDPTSSDSCSYSINNDTDTEDSISGRKSNKAFCVAREIKASEEVFVDVLKLLNVDFRTFVLDANKESKIPVIPETEFNKILNYLPQLQELNQGFLEDFKTRIENWEQREKISDVIVKKGPFLKLFSAYIKDFAQQCRLLDECCVKYPKFGKVVLDFESSDRCQKLEVKHYMLKPVQRIMQYRMLLEEYLKYQTEDSEDYTDTKEALNIMSEVADHANNIMKQGDQMDRLLALHLKVANGEVVKPGRVLLKEGELAKLSRRGTQPRYFILFNDSLWYTRYSSSPSVGPGPSYHLEYSLPLTGMRVSVPASQQYQNELSVISMVKSFTVVARSQEERDEWQGALNDAIERNAERRSTFQNQRIVKDDSNQTTPTLGRQAPVWIPDGRVTMCQLCTAEFTVTFRRHHCRACGKVVCRNCSANKAPLWYLKYEAARVCDDCYYALYEELQEAESKANNDTELSVNYETLKLQFRRLLPTTPRSHNKNKKYVPQRLREVCANDSGSQMSGYLYRRIRKSWKQFWFVLKDKVLYQYRASEDVVAIESIPLLGYTVQSMVECNLYEGIDAGLVFQLEHSGQLPLVFHGDSQQLTDRWIEEMKSASILES